jgi:hypothetical protein
MMRAKSYSELVRFNSFEDRFNYLKLDGSVGASIFGYDRYLNQNFYRSREWKLARDGVILRDNGCDLGISGHEIHVDPLVHHINPMTPDDLIHGEEWIFDPEFLILTTKETHNAIHFGNDSLLPKVVIERRPGDTKLW